MKDLNATPIRHDMAVTKFSWRTRLGFWFIIIAVCVLTGLKMGELLFQATESIWMTLEAFMPLEGVQFTMNVSGIVLLGGIFLAIGRKLNL